MKIVILPALIATLLGASGGLFAADLNVTVADINESEGRIRVAVYGSEKTFGKEKKAITVQETIAEKGAVAVKIRNLPPGRYGVVAYHDINRNGHFDHSLGLLPAEGYGLSNNPALSGAQDFAASTFEFAGDMDLDLTIQLRYCGDKELEGRKFSRTLSCWFSQSP